jgi:hypothetical protein
MASTYLSRTIGSPTNANKGTLSWWQKGATTNTTQYILACESGQERLLWYMTSGLFQGGLRGSGGSPDIDFTLVNTPRFRDPNAWYHCVLAWDSTQSTASDRIKFYVNGTQYTVTGNADIPQNHDMPMNKNGLPFRIGSTIGGGSYFEGVMSHIHFCDGTQYQASDFGETDSTTGEWKIKTSPSVSYGNNGFWWLKDTNTATDSSPNSNTPSISGTLTKTEDCPSNVFATLNPLANIGSASTYENGNTTITGNSNWGANPSTIATGTTGKYYAECKVVAQASAYSQFGIMSVDAVPNWTLGYVHTSADAIVWSVDHRSGQSKIESNNSSIIQTPTQFSDGDIIGMAIDVDNGKIYFHRNGTYVTYSGNVQNPSSGSYGINLPTSTSGYHIMGNAYPNAKISINFGNGYFGTTAVSSAGTNASNIGIFEYDVPTGYTALSTKGLNL